MAELRKRHHEEFDKIYANMLEAGNAVKQGDQRRRAQVDILNFIADVTEETGSGPLFKVICEHLSLPTMSASLWLRELRDMEIVIAPGSGSRSGYRLAEPERRWRLVDGALVGEILTPSAT